MKNLILAVILAAVPMTSFAQKKPQGKAAELDRGAAEGARSGTQGVEIAEAQKLQDSIAAAITELTTAGGAFLAAIKAEMAATDAAKGAAIKATEKTQAKLEIAGVKLEDLYGKAVRLRVKQAAAAAVGKGEGAEPVELEGSFAALKGMSDAAAARLTLAGAQLEGGRAAAKVVARKIARAQAGQEADIPAALAERLKAAAVEISRAKAALGGGKAVGKAAKEAARAAGGDSSAEPK